MRCQGADGLLLFKVPRSCSEEVLLLARETNPDPHHHFEQVPAGLLSPLSDAHARWKCRWNVAMSKRSSPQSYIGLTSASASRRDLSDEFLELADCSATPPTAHRHDLCDSSQVDPEWRRNVWRTSGRSAR